MLKAYIAKVDDETKNYYLRWFGSYDYFYVTTFIYAVLTPLHNLKGVDQNLTFEKKTAPVVQGLKNRVS